MPISQFRSAVAKIPQNIYISQFYLLFQAIKRFCLLLSEYSQTVVVGAAYV